MITKKEIEQFYLDLKAVGLVKPVAVMMEATGLKSSGTVSEYLSGKKKPSETFIKAFYEKVYKGSIKPPIASEDYLPAGDVKVSLKDYLEGLKQDKAFLQDLLLNKVEGIDSNLKKTLGGVVQLSLHGESAREVALESLARLEKKPKGALTGEADKIVKRLMKEQKKRDSSPVNGK